MEFFVCKQNLNHLSKHGPHYRRQFLKWLVTLAKLAGNANTGILHREDSRKWWSRANKSTQKTRGGLTVVVKVPTAAGGVDEFKTKEGVYQAVSAMLIKRF